MTSAAADPSSIDADVAAADARGRRPVWNVPSNGSIEVSPVMDAVSWPALSDAAKASPKSSSSDSLKSLSDTLPPAPTGPMISSPTAKPALSAPNPNLILSPMSPARSRSFKRGGAGGGSSSPANGGLSPPPQLAVPGDNARSLPDSQAVPEPSPRGPKPSGGPTPHHHSGPDQHRGYGGNRRGGNNGGAPHHNHGNRRDPEWNHPRGAHVQHLRGGGMRMYPRPVQPPVAAPFIPPPPPLVRPFVGNAMSFPDLHPQMYFVTQPPPPESIRGMPLVQQPMPPAMFFPAMDPQRTQLLKQQIEYYFSNDNLCKDVYLRQNMDEQGWVPVSFIAGFNRVKLLTNNIPYILDTVRMSNLVEVQGEKIRRRNDWMNWLLVPQSPKATDYDAVATHLQNVSLEGGHADVVLTRSASGNLYNQYQIAGDANSDAIGQLSGFSDPKTLSRCDTL